MLKKSFIFSNYNQAFTSALGGSGGGTANNNKEFINVVKKGLNLSPVNEVLIEESLAGVERIGEMEVIWDKVDNCIIVCSIENIDPMGSSYW